MTKKHTSGQRGATVKTDTPNKTVNTGAAAQENKPKINFGTWLNNHKFAFHRALFQLLQNKFATAITVLVIATALTLPAMFQIVNSNLSDEDDKLASHSGISVFLKSGLDKNAIDNFIGVIQRKPGVKSVEFISAEQALIEFQQIVGISSKTLLDTNPIPAIIYLTPEITPQSSEHIRQLKAWLQTQDETDIVRVDIEWIERLFSISTLIKNASLLLSLFLIFTMLIIIGNTIRLLAQHYYDEIMVSKLMGATDAYVRRPFLYSGVLFGLSGSIMACLFVYLGFLWLRPEINRVMNAFGGQINFIGLGFADVSSLLGIGILLGVGAAWIASNRIINEISI